MEYGSIALVRPLACGGSPGWLPLYEWPLAGSCDNNVLNL